MLGHNIIRQMERVMKVLIIGAGVIGTVYGWALSEAGCDITHYVRPGRSIKYKSGIIMDVLDSRKNHKKKYIGKYNVKTTEILTKPNSFDLVIIPTKPYQLEEALRTVVSKINDTDILLLTQNWYGTDIIDTIIPQSEYIFGDAKAGGTFEGNRLKCAIFPSIDIGQVGGQKSPCLAKVTKLFEEGRIKPTIQENILHYIWIQYAINAGFWPALVRAGGIGQLLKDRKTGDLTLFAVKECLEVVSKRGVDLRKYPDVKMYSNTSFLARRIAEIVLNIMFRFNESVKRTSAHALADPREIRESYYDLLNTGRKLGVEMTTMASFERDIIQFGGK